MTTSAFWAFGAALQLGDGASPENFTAIAEITDLAPPKMKKGSSDVTSYSSTSGYREFLPVLRDAGEVAIKANWLPNNVTQDETTGILASFNTDTNHNWKIVLPSSIATLAFAGHVTGFEPSAPLDKAAALAFSIKISGPITVS